MKVALVAEWLDPWRGGAETSTLLFIHHLTQGGVDLHVFTRSRPSPTPNMHVHTISGASMSRTRRSTTFAYRVEALLRADSFDVIHAVSPCRLADIYQPRSGTVAETIERNLATRRAGAARSIKRYANRFNFKQRYMLAFERQILSDRERPVVIAISDYVVRQLKHHYRLSDGRIRKIYNAVNPDQVGEAERSRNRAMIRAEFGISRDELLVLLVAHNFRLKGVARWMEALSQMVRQGGCNVRSIVVGRGESRHWHDLCARLGIADHLALAGPSDRVPAFYHACDVLVHPTYYDPCSRVVLEGMVRGVPCITTRWDGASEMIEDGVNGYVLADPDDAAALADRIELLRDVGVRRRMGEAAKAVSDHASMDKHVDAVMQLYREMSAVPTLG
ncbi:MAG: glycosyltransferase family 4 protein [Phycisphaerae bacterium]